MRVEMISRILIIDDEIHLAKILQFTLKHAGYEVDIAFDGKEGLSKVSSFAPNLIILDLLLPGIDGYEICNILKGDDDLQDIPILILSARDIKREGLERPLKADALMGKPFNTEKLLKKISKLLKPVL